MSHTLNEVKENLIGMGHSGTLNKVRNLEALLERAGNTMLAKISPMETMRVEPLTQVIHDDVNNYPLPTDFSKLVDLYPQANRLTGDTARRQQAEEFSIGTSIKNKVVSIESKNGIKYIRIDWKSFPGKNVNTMDSLTSNGTWSVINSASNLALDHLFKVSGAASIKFNVTAPGDGIQNTNLATLDLTDWDEQAEFLVPVFLQNASIVNSISIKFGNDLTTNYWTSIAQTLQQDGSSLRNGWNFLKFPWSSASETGAVDPSAINAFALTLSIDSALTNVRVDNIIVSLGRNFDLKYFSQYFIQSAAGVFIPRTTSDDDVVVFDGTAYNIFLHEAAIAIAQQVEGEDSGFDITFHKIQLNGDPSSPDPRERVGLYARYRAEYPAQTKKATSRYGSLPGRRRW